jgi:hypothetical protein
MQRNSLRAEGDKRKKFFRLFCNTGGIDMDPPNKLAGLPAEKICFLKSRVCLKNEKD